MDLAVQGRWIDRGDDRSPDIRPGASALVALVRAVATPSNLLLGFAVAAGWLALVAWTGVGPDSWQARSCADLDLGRAACSPSRTAKDHGKDQSRLAPHLERAGFAR